MKPKSIVIVSHSKNFAEGIKELIKMVDSEMITIAAGGLEDGSLGTSYEKIKEAVQSVYSEEGVLILADMGSSVMTSEMVIEDLINEGKENITICNYHTAEKIMDIISEIHNCSNDNQKSSETQKISWEYIIKDPIGLHARPAAAIIKLARTINDRIILKNESGLCASSNSITEILTLDITHGEKIEFIIEGNTANDSMEKLKTLIKEIL